MQAINISGLNKFYGRKQVLFDIDLDFPQAQMVALIGPSGSGKSTLLRHINGLNVAESGQIQVNGQDLFNNGRLNRQVRQQRSKIGYIFQQFNLVNRLSVLDNVLIGALGRIPKWRAYLRRFTQEEKQQAFDCLARVGLSEFVHQRASQLSGGQQQRVALARALVFEPEVILMDEPLGALDKQLREQMQLDIRALHQRLGVTIVFVTHDQEEALTMSDRIAVFNKGNIEQIASPREIYDQPKTKFVAEFIGATNLIEGKITALQADKAQVVLKNQQSIWVQAASDVAVNDEVYVSVRPEKVNLTQQSGAYDNQFPTTIQDIVYLGNHLRVQLDENAHHFIVNQDRKTVEWAKGAAVVAGFNAADCWMIKR